MKKTSKQLAQLVLLAAIAALLIFTLRPLPQTVETGRVTSGPLQETIETEGETRAHDRYTVAAPINGRLLRIGLHDGDSVSPNQVVAFMQPSPLDDRERGAAAARVSAAEALLQAAELQVSHDRVDLEQTHRDRIRMEQIALQGIVTQQELEQARSAEQRAASTLAVTEYRARAATAQLREARAALLAAAPNSNNDGRTISLLVPRGGPVLRVLEKSERVVTAGTPLLIIGDPRNLEVVVDVLSSDAVQIHPGAEVQLTEWGGAETLKARVRIVEPYAFTKVSALGVEEQRVNIIADLINPPAELGDGYRVVARIVTWSEKDVLKVPISALFRRGEEWCVFVAAHGRAERRTVLVGHRNQTEAQIIKGLTAGTSVVLHPSNQLDNGVRVRIR